MSALSACRSRRCRAFLARNNAGVLASILLCIAGVFFYQAQRIRAVTKHSNPDAFSEGDMVTVIEIIDGDDVLIEMDSGVKTQLRLVGVNAFDSTVSDPTLLEYGRICMRHLDARTKGVTAQLRIPAKRLGQQGRLLGTLYLKDSSESYTIDIGLELIRKGYALSYTRYAFEREPEYQRVEEEARLAKDGFWSDPVVVSRAIALKRLWAEERKSND